MAAGTIAAQCLQLGLLDVVAIDLVPVVMGGGRPFFPGLPPRTSARRPRGVRPGLPGDPPADAGAARNGWLSRTRPLGQQGRNVSTRVFPRPSGAASVTSPGRVVGPRRGFEMPKPTIVLVHGAWADGSSWNAVAGADL